MAAHNNSQTDWNSKSDMKVKGELKKGSHDTIMLPLFIYNKQPRPDLSWESLMSSLVLGCFSPNGLHKYQRRQHAGGGIQLDFQILQNHMTVMWGRLQASGQVTVYDSQKGSSVKNWEEKVKFAVSKSDWMDAVLKVLKTKLLKSKMRQEHNL